MHPKLANDASTRAESILNNQRQCDLTESARAHSTLGVVRHGGMRCLPATGLEAIEVPASGARETPGDPRPWPTRTSR